VNGTFVLEYLPCLLLIDIDLTDWWSSIGLANDLSFCDYLDFLFNSAVNRDPLKCAYFEHMI